MFATSSEYDGFFSNKTPQLLSSTSILPSTDGKLWNHRDARSAAGGFPHTAKICRFVCFSPMFSSITEMLLSNFQVRSANGNVCSAFDDLAQTHRFPLGICHCLVSKSKCLPSLATSGTTMPKFTRKFQNLRSIERMLRKISKFR